jgi:hypothetical protein
LQQYFPEQVVARREKLKDTFLKIRLREKAVDENAQAGTSNPLGIIQPSNMDRADQEACHKLCPLVDHQIL